MVKVYEFELYGITHMGEASAEGWEFVSGPVDNGARQMACLMRREVVPGRVAKPEPVSCPGWAAKVSPEKAEAFRNYVQSVMSFRPPAPEPVLTNCWSCKHATHDTEVCDAWHLPGVTDWVDHTHRADRHLPKICPPTADGCPGWTAKVTP